MNMKKIVALLLALILCVSLAACTGNTAEGADLDKSSSSADSGATPSPSEEGVYKIGVLFPQSGDFAFFASYFAPILDIYVADLNAKGGINSHAVQLVYKDDQGDPSITAQRLDELKDENISAVIGPFFDTCGPVAAQWAEKNKIPVVMCCALATDTGMANASKYVFTAGSSAWALAKVFASAVADKGYESVYYVGNEGGVPDDVYNFFWEEVEKLGLSVKNAGSIRLSGSETDLSSVITSIMAAKPDVIVTSLTAGGAVSFIQQGSQFGLFDESDLFGVYIGDADHTESVGSSYPVGNIWAISWFPITFGEVKDFAKETYEKSDKVIPCSASLTYYYAADSVCQALAALSYSEATNSERLVEVMENLTMDSILGEVSYTSYSHQLMFPMFFAGTAFSDEWGGIALPDESDYSVYGVECYPTEEEWTEKAAELGYKTLLQ